MAPKGNNNIPSLIPLKIVSGPNNLTTSSFEPQKPPKNLKQQKQKMILSKNEGKQKILQKKITDIDNRQLNKTFTISKSFNDNKEDKFQRKRSNSFDSDFVEFSGNGKLRIRVEKTCFAMDWDSNELKGRRLKNSNNNNNTFPMNAREKSERREINKNKDSTPKLPSLEGFLPGRTCCQLQFCRFSNLELLKYKRNLMKN